MDPCPFCDIAAGAVDGDLVVLRTPGVLVVPASRQRARNRGHMLVLPALHVTRLIDVGAPLLQDIYSAAGRVAMAARTAFGATGATLFQNDGSPDQVLLHVHVHVVPRRAGDDFRMPDPDAAEVGREERRDQAAALRRALGE
jgi:histidine triad (HIT) family protein